MTKPTDFIQRSITVVFSTVTVVALTSCAVGPNYERPVFAAPAAFKETGAAPATAGTPVVAANWWTLFNDPVLTDLAEKTVAANLNIKAAMARVEQARAALSGARGGFFPALDLNASVRRGRSSEAVGSGNTTTSYSLPLNLSYEIDLWGGLRRQYEYYRNTEEASAAEYAFVRQTALSAVAQGYFAIRSYDDAMTILDKAMGLYRHQLDLTETKFKAGLSLQTDVLQARTQLNAATNQLIDVQRARARQEHALAILLGLAPAEFTLAPREQTAVIPAVPAGLPATLLNQRPDVIKAERSLAAANARIGVAQADFYPTFSLTGSAGYESLDLGSLTAWKNRTWSLSPGLSLPIFQGGKLKATLAQARAGYAELLNNYHGAVLTAYQDVEDQLSELRLLTQKAASLEETLVSAREYFRLTELQYRQGLATYLQVINANQTLLTNELSAAQTRSDRLTAAVLLIRAIGGGWDPAASPAR